jgi:hypothetical protein
MRRIQNTAIGVVMAVSTLLSLSTAAQANPITGGGYSSSYAGESAFTNAGVGETAQFSAIFFNDGSTTWQPGVVGLLVCAADKITCNITSNSTFAKNWYSSTVYATVTTTVAPGQNGFFIYNITVPDGTPPGTATYFYGDVGIIQTGNMLRPEGYFQVNTVPAPTSSLVLSPASASIQVGQTQQFTVTNAPTGSTPTWEVLGGCGAVTAVGLFAATAMNSASQPCSVIARIGGTTGSAPISVFGQGTSLGCTATPTSVVANGGATSAGTSLVRIAIKDANGNTVANASSPTINVVNVTPTLATMTPTGAVTPSQGVATVTVTSTNTPGDIQLSASASGLTGCNVIINSGGVGAASKTVASYATNPIAADTASNTTLTVDVTDANGNRVVGDNTTVITITRDSGSTNVCNVAGVTQGSSGAFSLGGGNATAANGRVAFTIQATSTPGACTFFATTNNSSIAGTSATLTTQITGAPNKLAVVSNDSPKNVANSGTCTVAGGKTDQSCMTFVISVQDVNGSTVTSDNGRTITGTPGSGCNGAGGGNVIQRDATTTASGRATLVFSSAGAYPQCTITFSAAGIASVNSTVTWNSGGADHLACVFFPTPIPPNSTSISSATVSVNDQFNNVVTTGVYSVSFGRVSGSATTLITSSPQNTSGGYVVFNVRSNTTTGSDTYGPALAQGSLPGSNTTCTVEVQ